MLSGLRVANIPYLQQRHYDRATVQSSISEKTDHANGRGLMKTGNAYTNIFPSKVREAINAQIITVHEIVLIPRHYRLQTYPEKFAQEFLTV